jgi:23S rRNA (adenine2503-C2)-methyltransferase
MQQFLGISRSELEEYLVSNRFARVHAKALYRSAFRELDLIPWQKDGLPSLFRTKFATDFEINPPRIKSEVASLYDHSIKFVMQAPDGLEFETVLMPEKNRITLCVSSQIGCRQACSFCHTGKMGLKRNLTSGEIVGQLYRANQWLKEHPDWFISTGLHSKQRVSNIVFMGMGEPLDNVDEVVRSVEIMTDPYGFGLARRKMTISTAGHLDGLDKLLQKLPTIGLAVSLHAVEDRLRSQLMPINRRWSISDLLASMDRYSQKSGRSVLVQYTVIDGINDSLEHGQRLVELLRSRKVKVNLIPFNYVAPTRFHQPDPERLRRLKDYLHEQGIRVMVRYSKGQDIAAACGQLVRESQPS